MTLRHVILIPAAMASLGAAGIHFAVIEEHLAEYTLFGYLFLALAWFQTVWAFSFFLRQSRPVAWLGIVVNLGAVGVWVMSRTTGLPIGPEPWEPEAIGALDVAASALELIVVACSLVFVAPRIRAFSTSARVRSGWLLSAIGSVVVIAITSLAFVSQGAADAMR
jgi:hypothetical protein